MQPDEARSVLGVPASATRQEIKAAYRRLVKTWHPDRQGADEERRARAEDAVRRVIAAYECLQGRDTTPASTFSVRRPAPNPAEPGRRSRRSRAGARRRRRRRAAVWISVAVAVGVLLASFGAWSIRRAISSAQESADADVATLRASAPPPEPVKVQRAGNEYPVHNPTKELWVGCLAWVGPKWFRIGAVGPGETLRIPAATFDASLTPADTDRDMRVSCQPQ